VSISTRQISILLALEIPVIREALSRRIEVEGDLVLAQPQRPTASGDLTVADVYLVDHANLARAESVRLTQQTTSHIIVILADEAEEQLVDGLTRGATGFVGPGTPLDEVVAVIRGVANGETRVPNHLVGGVIRTLENKRRQADDFNRRLSSLTTREREILERLASGADRAAVAAELYISVHTVRTHVTRILAKLDVGSLLRAMSLYLSMTESTVSASTGSASTGSVSDR
jgi:DNA-binding NarL/FixJ family response regulator